MPSEPIVTGLWDYGWIQQDTVELAASPSDLGLIEQYIASTSFQTSFLQNDYEVGIHGPFVADRIHAGDYVLLQHSDLVPYLETLGVTQTLTLDASQRAEVLPHLEPAFARGRRCYVLTRDERNGELFHDWGYIFFLFRELLSVGQEPDKLERFVIAYE